MWVPQAGLLVFPFGLAIAVIFGAIIVGSVLAHAVRAVGYRLVRTYLAGTGPPTWAGSSSFDHVIKIWVGKVSTLDFGADPEKLHERARTQVEGQLDAMSEFTRDHSSGSDR